MNAYLKRLKDHDAQIQEASRQTYLQYMVDMFELTLNDPDVMGKDVFGHERIKRVINATSKKYDLFIDALSSNKNESDYWRSKLDESLSQIFPKEEFIPFNERYDYLKNLVPIGKEKK